MLETMKFMPGQMLATPGAMAVLNSFKVSPSRLLDRHLAGDWGDLSPEDKERNEEALKDGSRLFSAYKLNDDVKVWIITEAVSDIGIRSATTILLPDEY